MTKDRDFKRRVRERMAKTGESYTTARAHLLARSSEGVGPTAGPAPTPGGQPAAPTAGPDGGPGPSASMATLAGMSDDAVTAKTGRDWAEWTAWLDARSAAQLPHPDIARLVGEEVDSGWWAQTVTVGYERIRGLRETGQRRDGAYEANRSRTIHVDGETLFRWIAEPELRERWLPVDVEERAVNPPRSVRLDWPDGTRVQLYVEGKGDAKARISAQHSELPDRDALDDRRRYWSERLDTLKAIVS